MNHALINECIHYKGRDFHVIHIIKNSVASINEDYVYFDSLLLAYSEEFCEKHLYIVRIVYRHYIGGNNIILNIPKVEKVNCIIK